MSRTLIVSLVALLCAPAAAQTATRAGIVTQGRLCLTVPHTPRRGHVRNGTLVKAVRCDGRPGQRWVHYYGDENHLALANGQEVGIGSRDSLGRLPLVVEPARHERLVLHGGQLRVEYGSLCATRRGEGVFLEPCRAGDPRQGWRFP